MLVGEWYNFPMHYEKQTVAEWEPGYVGLQRSGELGERARVALARMAECTICPHRCRADRRNGARGVCRAGSDLVVASWNVHRWEEPPISGTRGSGTIFFSHCTGLCRFCQNYPISQLGYGNRVSIERLGEMMLELQGKRCHNINFVTPTHFVPQIIAAVDWAAERGLRIPLVYNSSGFETVETLRLLDGMIDVWLPDAKYADDRMARKLSGFPHYVEANRAALQEIYRQVGDELAVDDEGTARRGMIVRHLVLPEGRAGTREVLDWIARELSPQVHVSLMDQYFPAYKVLEDPVMGRKITDEEYEEALDAFEAAGMVNGWMQEHECEERDT